MSKRNIIAEISTLKSRDEFSQRHNFTGRLWVLQDLIDAKNVSEEVFRYVPIALVACFEGFFRSSYAEIIDYGSPYRGNITKFNQTKNTKLDFNIINAIKDEKISVGEFISHVLPCNNFSDIDKNMSTLLACCFSKSIKGFSSNSIFEDINEVNKKFNANPDKIIKDIQRIFELRHIFCHEFAIEVHIDKDEIRSLLSSAEIFLEHVDGYIWHTLYPNAPETQAGMNRSADQEAKKLDKQLSKFIHLIKLHEFKDDKAFDKDLLEKSMIKWKEYRDAEAKLKASRYEGGTMYPLVYLSSFSTTTERKVKELQKDYADAFKEK